MDSNAAGRDSKANTKTEAIHTLKLHERHF